MNGDILKALVDLVDECVNYEYGQGQPRLDEAIEMLKRHGFGGRRVDGRFVYVPTDEGEY